MSNGLRRHPDLVLVKVTEAGGYGFTYLAEKYFNNSADSFLLPVMQSTGGDPNDPEQKRTLAYDFLWRFFNKPNAKEFFRENVRWIAAAAVREKFSVEASRGAMPRVVMISRKSSDSGIAIADADEEYLGHPGYPRAVIVGKPEAGGGEAHFFSSRKAYERVGASKPSQDIWLPQIVYRLYGETPSVVMGLPKPGREGSMSVECLALSFGREAKLVERT